MGTLEYATFTTSVATVILGGLSVEPAGAQGLDHAIRASCPDAAKAFTLRNVGSEELAVADPAASGTLKQSAQLFYRCAQTQENDHFRDLFLAYYADTLYEAGENAGDARASALATSTAQRLNGSKYSEVRRLIARIVSPTPEPTATATAPPAHSDAYCREFAPDIIESLQALESATESDIDAGNNDTEVLATTTARYGGAFKTVEDDFTSSQTNLGSANSAVSAARSATAGLNAQEGAGADQTLQALQATITYIDSYSRLALKFERGINGANRQLARAKISKALASGQRDSSTTYSNGSASCNTYGSNTNCYGNSSSTTTYNNSATIAQQNASNAIAAAEAGRLSYSQADSLLTEGLPLLNQIRGNIDAALNTWHQRCVSG